MNVASGIVLIVAGLTAANPFPREGYDQYSQLGNNGNDFDFVPDGYGAVLPQNFEFNPFYNAFGNNAPQYQRAMPRFDQRTVRNYQDFGNKFRQASDNLNSRTRQAVLPENVVPLFASRIAPFPVGRLMNRGFENSQNFPRGDRSSISSANSAFSGLKPDFLKPATSVFSAASASSAIAQTMSGFSGSQSIDSQPPHGSSFPGASSFNRGIAQAISGASGSQNFDSPGLHTSGHPVPSGSNIVTQVASGSFGQRPDFLKPPTSGFPLPSASNVIAQATSAFRGSQDSNSRVPFNVVNKITSSLSKPFNSNEAPISGPQVSSSLKPSGSTASLLNASQRTERSSSLVSSSNNDQFTTSQPITQITPNSIAETTTTPTLLTPTTTTITTSTAESIQPAGSEVIASASSAAASASSNVVSEKNDSGSVTKVSSSTSTSSSASSASVEAPASTSTSSNSK